MNTKQNDKISHMKQFLQFNSAAILFLVVAIFSTSCSKKNDEINVIGEGTKLMFKVSGVIGENLVSTAISKNKLASSNPSSMVNSVTTQDAVHTEMHSNAGFGLDVKTIQAPIAESLGQKTVHSTNGILIEKLASTGIRSVPSNRIAATSPMDQGKKYRLLLYKNNEEEPSNVLEIESREEVVLDVAKGDTYKWYAYSYNEDTLPALNDTKNPTVEAPINKDLLYASGETTIPTTAGNVTQRIDIVFKHKMAQVKVAINGEQLARFGTIDKLEAKFVKDDYLKSAVFNIKENELTDLTVVPTSEIFNGTNAENYWEAVYYTADPASLTSYEVHINELVVTFNNVDPAMATVDLVRFENSVHKPVPLIKKHSFTNPQAGQVLFGETGLSYIMTEKRILHISNNTTYAYSFERGGPWQVLNDLRNFGNLPESLVRMVPNPITGSVWKGAQANSEDNKENNWLLGTLSTLDTDPTNNEIIRRLDLSNPEGLLPDIVVVGHSHRGYSTGTIEAITEYINAGGVFLMFNERIYEPPTKLIASILEVDPSTLEQVALPEGGSMYPMVSTVNDLFTNGPFGDARNELWGEDSAGCTGYIGLPADRITVYSFGQAINRPNNAKHASAVSMFRHKTKNFYYLGDGGISSWVSNSYTGAISSPFKYDPATGRPLPKPYGDAGNGYVARSRDAYNSVLLGNLMLWAGERTEFGGIGSWRYDPTL